MENLSLDGLRLIFPLPAARAWTRGFLPPLYGSVRFQEEKIVPGCREPQAIFHALPLALGQSFHLSERILRYDVVSPSLPMRGVQRYRRNARSLPEAYES